MTYLCVCLIAEKMSNNQEILRHDKVSQHAFFCRENIRSLQLAVLVTSFVGEGSSSRVHVSLALSFQIYVSNTALEIPSVLEAFIAPDALKGFPRGPYGLSLLPLYSDHATKHLWKGDVV